MTNNRRYALIWLAALFLGLNAGAGALVVALALVDNWLHWEGTLRTIVLCSAAVLATLAMTLAIGKALVRRVTKQLN
jgi:ABC-type proline/glycine betaine transport system permease subunit